MTVQKTSTFLMFVGDQAGKCEEAIRFYVSLFEDSSIDDIRYFVEGQPGGKAGQVMHAELTLAGVHYHANDSAGPHPFTFTPAISIYVSCETLEEIERLATALADGGSYLMPLANYGFSQQFAWVADRYGVTWQLNLAA